ncbi:MAG: SpoIIE family protein phosphatase [Bacteroidota bacterium]
MNKKIKNIIYFFLSAIIVSSYFALLFFLGFYFTEKTNDLNPVVDSHSKNKSIISKIVNVSNEYPLHGKWKLVYADTINFDSLSNVHFTEIKNIDSLPDNYKGEPIWLVYQSVLEDSILFNRPIYLEVFQKGASIIYLSGEKILDVGHPANNIENETSIIYSQPVLLYLNKPFTIFIKHSELKVFQWKNLLDNKYNPGIKLSLNSEPLRDKDHSDIVISFIIGFLLTLAFIHFAMYVSYRQIKDNLYFSIFLMCYGLVWIGMLCANSSVFEIYALGNFLIMEISIKATFITLILFIQNSFHQKLNKILWLIIYSTLFFSIADSFTNKSFLSNLNLMLTIWLVIFTIIYIFISVRKSYQQKIPGIKIISAGIFLFGTFVFLIISLFFFFLGKSSSSGFNIHFSFEGSILNLIISIFSLLALFSIPISMSIFLAYRFAYTNKHLQNKLIEVENLNKTIIEKEKEKQNILLKQNEILEQQVKERTEEITAQKNLLEQKNKDITDSINYAFRIQKALITSDEFIHKHFINENYFSDFFVLYLPKDIVSGDFYWANVNTQHPQQPHYFAVGDCTGHGVPGAFMSLLNINFLNEAVIEKQIYYPDEILNYVREKLVKNLSYDEQQKDGMDATLLLFDNDFKQHLKIYYTLANHQLLLIRNNELFTPTGDKKPVGFSYSNDPFSLKEIVLQKGDWLYLFTDGYKDQFGGPKGKRLMQKNFMEIIKKHSNKKGDEQMQALQEQYYQWKEHQEQIDDVCVVGIRIG